jgi:signal transduction histidine kinase
MPSEPLHELNNLLAVVLSYADLIAESLEPDDPRRADVDEILRAARRAAELISGLRTPRT